MLRHRSRLSRAIHMAVGVALAISPVTLAATAAYLAPTGPAHAFKLFQKGSSQPKGGGQQGRTLQRADGTRTIDILRTNAPVSEDARRTARQYMEQDRRAIPQWHSLEYGALLSQDRGNPDNFANIGNPPDFDAFNDVTVDALARAAARMRGDTPLGPDDYERNQQLAARGIVIFPNRDQYEALERLGDLLRQDSTKSVSDLSTQDIDLLNDYIEQNAAANIVARESYNAKKSQSNFEFFDARQAQGQGFGDRDGHFDNRPDDNSDTENDDEMFDGQPLYDD